MPCPSAETTGNYDVIFSRYHVLYPMVIVGRYNYGVLMFLHLKRLFQHSIVYGMAETISRGIGFVLVFLYARVLTPDDLGIRTAVYGASAFVGIFYTLGLDNAFLRYFMDRDLDDRKREIFSSAFFFSSIIGIAFLIVAFLLDDPLSALLTNGGSYPYIMRLLFLILIIDNLVIYPTLVLRAENRLGYYSLIAFLRFFLFIALNLLLVWAMGRGLRGVFEANFLVVLILILCMLPVYRTYLDTRISFPILRRMLAFGVPTIFTILCMRVIDLSDRYVIVYLLGDEGRAELGRYSVAYTLGMVGIMVFVNSFRLAWQPFFLSLKDDPANRGIFSRIATYYTMFIGMVFTGIFLFRREIFTLYASDRAAYPASLSAIVPVVSLAYIFFGLYIIMLAGVFIREKTRYLPVVTSAAAALNVGLNFYFVPRYGIIGAAYTTVIAYIVMVVLMYVVSRRIYHVSYEFGRLGIVAVVTAAAIGASYAVTPPQAAVNFLFRAFLFAVPPIVYYFGGVIQPVEKAKIAQLVRNALRIRR